MKKSNDNIIIVSPLKLPDKKNRNTDSSSVYQLLKSWEKTIEKVSILDQVIICAFPAAVHFAFDNR